MKNIYLKYTMLFLGLVFIMSYLFFIDTGYKQENLIPFFIITTIISIGFYFLFKIDKKRKK